MSYVILDASGNKVRNELKAFDNVMIGAEATGDPEVILAFRDDQELLKWSDGAAYGEKVQQFFTMLDKEVLPRQQNADMIEQMQTLGLKLTEDNLTAYARVIGHPALDDELIQKIMGDKSPLTPAIFDPIILWDGRIEREPPQSGPEDSRTSMLFVPSGWWPWLGWVGWDNRARSARVFGLNVLCDSAWFGGQRAWIIGFNMLLNLNHLAFDRRTTSVVSF